MINYLKFDIKKYIQDYDINEVTLRGLREQLAEITELSAPNDSPKVQTSPRTDGMGNLVLRRISLKAQIAEYEEYFSTYHKAYNKLTATEKLIIDTFYRGHDLNPVTTLKRLLGYEQAQIYKLRLDALNKFTKLIMGI